MCCTSKALPLVQETDEFLAATGLLKFTHCLGFDLANTFTSYFENMPYFFQGITVTVTQPVPQLDDFTLSVA